MTEVKPRRSTSDGFMPRHKEVTMGGSIKGKKEFHEALGAFAKNPKLKSYVDYSKGMDKKPGKIERAVGRNGQSESNGTLGARAKSAALSKKVEGKKFSKY